MDKGITTDLFLLRSLMSHTCVPSEGTVLPCGQGALWTELAQMPPPGDGAIAFPELLLFNQFLSVSFYESLKTILQSCILKNLLEKFQRFWK